jgi:hypothetical protein
MASAVSPRSKLKSRAAFGIMAGRSVVSPRF